jgi:hypothetical protein
LAANADAQARTALADGWWDRSAKERGLAQKHIQRHAATIYTELLPSLTGLTKGKVEKRIASLTTAGVAFGARAMALDEILTRFTFPNKTFHLDKDAVTGMTEPSGDSTKFVWLTNTEAMQNFEYGLSMKAKWYQMAFVEIDGQAYGYSRGHWGNGESMLYALHKSEIHVKGKVDKADAWAAFKLRVADNKVTITYNGEVVGTLDVLTPITPASKIRVGFTSHATQISVKDVYLVEK